MSVVSAHWIIAGTVQTITIEIAFLYHFFEGFPLVYGFLNIWGFIPEYRSLN